MPFLVSVWETGAGALYPESLCGLGCEKPGACLDRQLLTLGSPREPGTQGLSLLGSKPCKPISLGAKARA